VVPWWSWYHKIPINLFVFKCLEALKKLGVQSTLFAYYNVQVGNFHNHQQLRICHKDMDFCGDRIGFAPTVGIHFSSLFPKFTYLSLLFMIAKIISFCHFSTSAMSLLYECINTVIAGRTSYSFSCFMLQNLMEHCLKFF
jgi:hypothetical protein